MDAELVDSPGSPFGFRHAVFALLFTATVLGVPLSWRKLRGGVTLDWIGYVLILSSYGVGVSERRAEWCVRWCRRMREGHGINTTELEEGVGRLSFVAGILDYPRPWLSPLYSFLSTVPRDAIRVLPPYVCMAPRYLEFALSDTRLVPCGRDLPSWPPR